MKKLTGIFLLTFCFAFVSQAQKLGYVDSQYILDQMDEYEAAQEEISAYSKKWQKELEDMHANIEVMYDNYRAEEVLLTDDVKKLRQEDIYEAERKAKEYKQGKFGYDGELYKIQDEKIKPIQDKVYAAIEEVAKERRLDIILDKSGNSGILYTNASFDRTDDVMVKLGMSRK